MMSSEQNFQIFFHAVFKSSVMLNAVTTTLTSLIFSTLWKCLVVSACFFVAMRNSSSDCLHWKPLILVDFLGTLDEHMHLLLPALIRLFRVDASVDIRRASIKTLTRLIPRVQVGKYSFLTLFASENIVVIFANLAFNYFPCAFVSSGHWSHISPCASLEASLGWVCFLFLQLPISTGKLALIYFISSLQDALIRVSCIHILRLAMSLYLAVTLFPCIPASISHLISVGKSVPYLQKK